MLDPERQQAAALALDRPRRAVFTLKRVVQRPQAGERGRPERAEKVGAFLVVRKDQAAASDLELADRALQRPAVGPVDHRLGQVLANADGPKAHELTFVHAD